MQCGKTYCRAYPQCSITVTHVCVRYLFYKPNSMYIFLIVDQGYIYIGHQIISCSIILFFLLFHTYVHYIPLCSFCVMYKKKQLPL